MMLKFAVVQQVLVVAVILLTPLPRSTHSSPHHEARERAQIARQWAPLVWLHPEEQFFPDSVPAFLAHITPSLKVAGEGVEVDEGVATFIVPPLPMGAGSRESFLKANHDFECSACPLPRFLYGRVPDQHYTPPVYAVIHSCYSPPHNSRESRNVKPSQTADINVMDTNISTATTEPYRTPTTLTSIIMPPQTYPINITEPVTDINVSTEDRSLTYTDDTEVTTQPPFTVSTPGTERDSYTQPPETEESFPTPGESKVERSTDASDYQIYDDVQSIQKELKPGNDTLNQHWEARTLVRTPARQHTFTVTYWMFYPYNRGKAVCSINLGYFLGRMAKPRDKRGMCHGEEVIMGDHVGDWEHVSIQFKGRTPTKMYVSTHTFGAYYTYDHQHRHFVYSGKDVREGLALPISPHYPGNLHLVDSRPILYSTKGSHGLWAAAGVHQYNWIPVLLDETGKGTLWKTWKNLNILDLMESETLTHHRSWWGYEGRWGNPSERCHLLMAAQCEVNQGPTGIPLKRINFPCSHPNP